MRRVYLRAPRAQRARARAPGRHAWAFGRGHAPARGSAGTPRLTKKRARRSASAQKPRRRKGSSADGGKGGKAAAQKRQKPKQRKQRRALVSDSETDEEDEGKDEEEYLLEEITAHRISGSSVEYLVRWAPVNGEEESEQTWELLANVRTTEALEAYLSRQHTGGASK